MKRLIDTAARHPWAFLLLLGLLSGLAVTRTGDLRVSISVQGMMERGTPAWRSYREAERIFGSDSILVIAVSDAELFTPEKLNAVMRALDALEVLPFVSATTSLFSVRNLMNEDGYISAKPYIERLPASAAEATAIRDRALSNPLVVGNLLSADGHTLAINVSFNEAAGSPDFPQRASAAIEAVLEPLRREVTDAFQIGGPAVRAALGERILHDQKGLLPLSLLVLLATLAFTLRRLSGALVPLLTAGLSVLWTLGLMAALQVPVNVMTSIVPALLIVIGSTEDIHLLSEYFAGVRQGLPRLQAIDFMAEHMGLTVLLTFVTTYIGFLSVALNDVELLRQFGLIASTGLLFNFLITVTLIPVLLRLFGREGGAQGRPPPRTELYQRWALALVEQVARRRWLVLSGVGLLTVLALLGAVRLQVNNNPMDFLAPDSPIHARAEMVHRRLSGIHTFSIVVDGDIHNTFMQVRYLRELSKIQRWIDTMGVFDKSMSFADFVSLVHQVMAEETAPQLPDTDDLLREYMLFIKHDDVRQYVSPAYDQARILVRHNIGSSRELNQAVRQLTGFVDAEIDPALHVTITGESILSNHAVDAMARGQLTALLLLGGAIVLIIAVLFVNLKAGLVALLPNLFPVVLLFGVMGYAGIPLDTGTGMVAAIALGICIDDTMHAMARYHMGLRATRDQDQALRHMVRTESVPIFTTSVALAAGFSVLALSSFAPVVHFGLLSAMVILLALVASFVITPLLLGHAQLLTVWDLLALQVRDGNLKRAPLFRGMRLWQIKKVLLASEIRPVAAGEYVVREGERGNEMFVVIEGSVVVQKHQADGSVKAMRILPAGQLFGEVGPVTDSARTADVVAREETQLLVLTLGQIDRLSRLFPLIAAPLFRNFVGILSTRLIETSEYRSKPGTG